MRRFETVASREMATGSETTTGVIVRPSEGHISHLDRALLHLPVRRDGHRSGYKDVPTGRFLAVLRAGQALKWQHSEPISYIILTIHLQSEFSFDIANSQQTNSLLARKR